MSDDEPDDGPEHGQTYGIILPFLDSDPRFAYGVEMGMLFARMHPDWMGEAEVSGYFTTANQEQITLAANRLGWVIGHMEPWPKGDPDAQWFWVEMHRKDVITCLG